MRRYGRFALPAVAVGVLVAVGGAVVPAGAVPVVPAGVSTPPGTVVVPHGEGRLPGDFDEVVGVVPQGVVYTQDPGPLSLVPPTGDPVTLGTGEELLGTAGSFLVFRDLYGLHTTTRWYDAATGTGGVAPSGWLAAAPGGGLLARDAGPGTTTIVRQDVSGARRVLGVVPVGPADVAFQIVSGADGAVVMRNRSLTYLSYDGAVQRSYDLSGIPGGFVDCGPPSAELIACTAGSQVFTVPVAGATAATVVAGGQIRALDPQVTATSVVWLADVSPQLYGVSVLRSVPRGGGPVATSPVPVTRSLQIASDGRRVYFRPDTEGPQRPVLMSDDDAVGAPRLYAPAPLPPYAARLPRLGPGDELVYTDNSRSDAHADVRTVRRTGEVVQVLAASQLLPPLPGEPYFAGAELPTDIDVSGARVGSESGYDTRRYTVVSPLLPTYATAADAGGLAGHRALTLSGRRLQLVDLLTGTATTVTPNVGGEDEFAFAGDRIVWQATSGEVRSRDLETGEERVVFTRGKIRVVRAWGDHVVVGYGSPGTPTAVVIDLRTGVVGPPVATANGIGSAGPAGYVLPGDQYSGVQTLVGWDGTHRVTVNGSDLTATADVLAWLGPGGQVQVAPLPWTVPDPPRSYGHPLAPATVASGAAWTFDLPTSAQLSTCSVRIATADRTIRSLPCEASSASSGDAVVTWDTRDAAGAPVRPGAYTWSVVAANADGALQRPDGSAGAITGTVTVTG